MFQIVYASRDTTHLFREIAITLEHSFESLGIPCTSSIGVMSKSKINIILDYHRMIFSDTMKNFLYIPFQLEQLYSTAYCWNENTMRILSNATFVWDYSHSNVVFLQRNGIHAQFMPIGYHKKLNVIRHDKGKSIDVLFFGTINKRREIILNQLGKSGINIKSISGVYGEERDEHISLSKIVLNIHYHKIGILEMPRVSYLLNNESFVISEKCSDNSLTGVDIIETAVSNIAERCQYFLEDRNALERHRKRTAAQFKRLFDMPTLLHNFIKHYCCELF